MGDTEDGERIPLFLIALDRASHRHLIDVLDRATIVGAGAQTHLMASDAVRRAVPATPQMMEAIRRANGGDEQNETP